MKGFRRPVWHSVQSCRAQDAADLGHQGNPQAQYQVGPGRAGTQGALAAILLATLSCTAIAFRRWAHLTMQTALLHCLQHCSQPRPAGGGAHRPVHRRARHQGLHEGARRDPQQARPDPPFLIRRLLQRRKLRIVTRAAARERWHIQQPQIHILPWAPVESRQSAFRCACWDLSPRATGRRGPFGRGLPDRPEQACA